MFPESGCDVGLGLCDVGSHPQSSPGSFLIRGDLHFEKVTVVAGVGDGPRVLRTEG